MKLVNLTPHTVRLNDGREIPPSGKVARVATAYNTTFSEGGVVIYRAEFGPVQGLPEPQTCPICGEADFYTDGGQDYCTRCNHDIPERTVYITSALVAQAARRPDVVSPATGHPEARRDEKGQIISVPGFVQAA